MDWIPGKSQIIVNLRGISLNGIASTVVEVCFFTIFVNHVEENIDFSIAGSLCTGTESKNTFKGLSK